MEKAIKRPARIHALLYIYRNRSSGFWWVAVPFVDAGGRRRQRRRSFRDSRYGSEQKALRAARCWRDEQIALDEVRAAMGDQRPLTLYADAPSEHPGSRHNPFGLVGITPTFRQKPLGGNFSVTANRGRKKWFSMKRYGVFGAFREAVIQRCRWVGAAVPPDEELQRRFQPWAERNRELLRRHGLEPSEFK